MSNACLLAALDEMESWLADPIWEPEPEALAEWNIRFQQALGKAEKAEGWQEIAKRAHALGYQLEQRLQPFVQLRNEIKFELNSLESGNRALQAYGSSIR